MQLKVHCPISPPEYVWAQFAPAKSPPTFVESSTG